ncbi:MAG: PorT family protein [Ignavibacteriaceae bacterium]|nr:porin family protein [Ignavibacteria bacterium]NUM63385.1 PorT family protein [Ignavibacteriaceae bacterium]
MIKNFIALTFFIFILGNNSFAQVQLSLWGGVNNSSFGGNPPEDAGYGDIRGLAAGANLDFHPSTDFVISLEPSFEQRGSTIDIHLEEGLEDTTLKFKVKQNYFGLGLMFKVNAGNFFVGSGLSAQLLSSAKLEYESQEKDIKDKFINYDALAFFNIGYKIPIGGPSLFVELRYIQGLINIRSDENESDTEIYLSNFKSTGLRLSTGILVPL